VVGAEHRTKHSYFAVCVRELYGTVKIQHATTQPQPPRRCRDNWSNQQPAPTTRAVPATASCEDTPTSAADGDQRPVIQEGLLLLLLLKLWKLNLYERERMLACSRFIRLFSSDRGTTTGRPMLRLWLGSCPDATLKWYGLLQARAVLRLLHVAGGRRLMCFGLGSRNARTIGRCRHWQDLWNHAVEVLPSAEPGREATDRLPRWTGRSFR
jgi:hypothetical protein